jgi:O-antigen/teichoic acid export membrane protein
MTKSESQKIVVGLGWVTATSYVNRAFGFVTTLVLARLLAPDQFGAVAVGAMMVDVLKTFRDVGLGQALIYRKDTLSIASDTALTIITGLNLVLFGLGALAASTVAAYFHDPSLTPVLIVMSGVLIPIGLRSVPEALIRKEGRFDKLVVPEIVPVFVSSAIGLVLAAMGLGVWSLVARTLIASSLGAILIWMYTDYRPKFRFDKKIAGELMGFGKFIVGATLLSVALYNVDKFFLGKFGGVKDLGIYTMAWAIASIPVSEFGHLLCRVAFPILCQLNGQAEKLRNIFLSSQQYNALIVAPLGIGLAIFGPDLAALLLGPEWMGIGVPLRWLALASVLRAISSLTHELFRATGQVKRVQSFTFMRLLMVGLLGIPALQFGGINALCALVLVSNALVLMIELHMVASSLHSKRLDIVRPIVGPIAMAGVAFSVPYAAYAHYMWQGSIFLTPAAVLVGVALYVVQVISFNPGILADVRSFMGKKG